MGVHWGGAPSLHPPLHQNVTVNGNVLLPARAERVCTVNGNVLMPARAERVCTGSAHPESPNCYLFMFFFFFLGEDIAL